MKGVFFRKSFNITLFLILLFGMALIGFYIFFDITDPKARTENFTFLIMGVIICFVVIPLWLHNYGAFIHIGETRVKAKYNWFAKIDCEFSDVDFAVAQVNTLIIQLKNGKTHTITGIRNPIPLANLLLQKIHFEINEEPEILIERLKALKKSKKRHLVLVFVGSALMFINIFVTVFLTGERDLHQFSQKDWIVFTVMGVIEMVIVVATFIFAAKSGKNNITMEKLHYQIRRKMIETAPLPSGNVVKVLTDEVYSLRVAVFGFPNDTSVYYVVQGFSSNFTFLTSDKSNIFESIEILVDSFEELVDITEKIHTA